MKQSRETAHSILYVLFLAGICVYSFLHPYFNWDLIGYTGATLAIGEKDPVALQSKTFAYVKASIPDSLYNLNVSSANPYRKTAASDPIFFEKQVRLFSVRPLYISIIYLLSSGGINIVQAIIYISVISSFFIGILLWLWLRKYLQGLMCLAACCFLIPLTGITEIARLLTPDALSGLLILTSFYFLIEKRQVYTTFGLLLLSILARPDNILFIIILAGYIALYAADKFTPCRRMYSSVIIVSLALFIVVQYFLGGKEIAAFFPVHYPGDIRGGEKFSLTLFMVTYVRAMAGSIKHLIFDGAGSSFFIFTGMGLFGAYKLYSNRMEGSFFSQLSFLSLLTIAVHIIVFPVIDDRFFVPYYIVIGIWFITDYIRPDVTSPVPSLSY